MTASVDDPLLGYDRSGLVSRDRAGRTTIGSARRFRALDALAALGCTDFFAVRWMDDPIRIAVEDDGADARGAVPHAAGLQCPKVRHPGVAAHGCERRRQI